MGKGDKPVDKVSEQSTSVNDEGDASIKTATKTATVTYHGTQENQIGQTDTSATAILKSKSIGIPDGLEQSPALIINPSLTPQEPQKPLQKGRLTPEGRRYRSLYEELKRRYLEQKEDHNKTVNVLNDEYKYLKDQLTGVTAENEKLRQEGYVQRDNERVSTGIQTEGSDDDNTDSSSSNGVDCNPRCRIDMCITEDEDGHKFECNRCKKLFQYECTNLPTYQIAHFLTTNNRRYICVNCTVIPDYVADVIKNKKASSPVSTTMANGDVADNLMSSLKSFLTER